jgi:phosphoribosylglycinamide formyltransferase-1
VEPCDTPDTLAARVLQAEHKLYPAALEMLAEGRVKLQNGRAVLV